MAKVRRIYGCSECAAQLPKWQGQCPECGAWNTLTEERAPAAGPRSAGSRAAAEIHRLDSVPVEQLSRIGSGMSEFDRVLGGGLVPGAVVLIGGDPGIGKSTLLLCALAGLSDGLPSCYVTGEESVEQIGLRAKRLGVASAPVDVLAETCVEAVIDRLKAAPPGILVIDSIQMLYSEGLQSAPGSVSQVRECAAQLVRFSKTHGVATVLVGHVTKEGALAGPRVLEHMVDTVLYFESDMGSRYRVVRAVKNRFGAANEMGFFAMSDDGFRQVRNPSAIFLAGRDRSVAGSVTLVTREGTRPVLVEVQALVDQSLGQSPRRLTQGLDGQRLGMLLAVLHRHCGIYTGDCDVYANVVGGLRVSETASDLAVSLAVLSSLRERPLDAGLAVFGEVGLTGEVRPVPYGEERLIEAAKQGFRKALVPNANRPRRAVDIETVPVARLEQAVSAAFG